MNKKQIVIGGLLAALYIVLTAINPIGYGIVQLRISAIISILPFYRQEYRLPCIAAVGIANIFSPLGAIDIATGIFLWILAYYLLDRLPAVWIKLTATALFSGLLVGGELSLVLGIPFLFNFVSISISQGIVFAIAAALWTRLTRAHII